MPLKTLEDCPAYVKVKNSGICMVRVEKRIEKPTKDYDLYSLKATCSSLFSDTYNF
jgi:hypothetical protein